MNVLVLDGNENQAVAATRSLWSAGHRVVVGAETRWSKAGWSRCAADAFQYPSPGDDVDGFLESVSEQCRARGDVLVLPMTEQTMLPLSRHRERLGAAGGSLVLPAHDQVMRACSKKETTSLAASLGMRVPETWTLDVDERAVRQLAGRVAYPVVLKPAMSQETIGPRMRTTGAPLYARDAEELLAQWRCLMTRSRTIVVQPFVEGYGAGYFALVAHGQVCVEFAHRRIRDVRPTGSGSAVRESVEVEPRFAEPARRLLQALGWHGVAMVEYRVAGDGTPVFLEVNPRFWNSLPLAVAAGVDFPRLLVEMAVAGRVPQQPAYRTGIRCRWWLGDVQHLAQVMRGAPHGYPGAYPRRGAALASFLAPHRGTVHDNCQWGDPWPEAGDWLHFLGRRLPAWLGRMRRTPLDIPNAEGRTAHS